MHLSFLAYSLLFSFFLLLLNREEIYWSLANEASLASKVSIFIFEKSLFSFQSFSFYFALFVNTAFAECSCFWLNTNRRGYTMVFLLLWKKEYWLQWVVFLVKFEVVGNANYFSGIDKFSIFVKYPRPYCCENVHFFWFIWGQNMSQLKLGLECLCINGNL